MRANNAAAILQEKGYKYIHNLESITKCEKETEVEKKISDLNLLFTK